MSISINSSRSEQLAKATQTVKSDAENKQTKTSGTESPIQSTGDKVSISGQGSMLSAQNQALDRQASMTPKELHSLRSRTQDDMMKFDKFFSGSPSADRSQFLPKTDDPERLALAQKAIDFSVAIHQSPPGKAPNPYASMDRDKLSAMAYDDSGAFSEAERYAAFGALQKQDFDHLNRLTDQANAAGDNSIMYKGLLDYFDEMTPVEQAGFEEGWRVRIEDLLKNPNDTYAKKDSNAAFNNLSKVLLDSGITTQERMQKMSGT